MKHLSKFLSDTLEIGMVLTIALSQFFLAFCVGLLSVLAIFGSLGGGGGDSDGDY